MSFTGWWGDKVIVNLKSDGVRRHKKWCKHYSYGECDKLCGKCIGSAFCEQYVNGIAEAEPVWRSREDVSCRASVLITKGSANWFSMNSEAAKSAE